MDNLIDIASRFRKAIESTNQKQRPICMAKFPNGACGDATLLLGTYLIDLGEEPFNYMLGDRGNGIDDSNWSSHAWLQRDTLIVDITADQFPENKKSTIVTHNSPWHESLNGMTDHIADYKVYEKNTMSPLGPFYKVLVELMKCT